MTDEQLTAIEQRANAAAPGPWWVSFIEEANAVFINGSGFFRNGTLEIDAEDRIVEIWTNEEMLSAENNAAFIAAARSDVPALAAEVRRLQTEIDKHKQWEQMAVDHFGDVESAGMAAHSEALTLFESMKAQLYPESEAKPVQTTAGVVLQISNMVAGLRNERDQLRFAAFGRDVMNSIYDAGDWWADDTFYEYFLPVAEQHGLVMRVPYDPAIHGEGIDADEGEEIWWIDKTQWPVGNVEIERLRADIERLGRERDQMVAANVELQERTNETHDALRTMAQSWLTLAASYDASPRHQGEAETLKQCAYHLARMWDATNHPIEPEEDK